MEQVRIKSCNVTNKDNVIVQIPKWVVELWDIKDGDKLDMTLDKDGKSLVIKKQERG